MAPILYGGCRSRRVYLPKGEIWIEHGSRREYDGGCWVTADAPLDVIPVFVRKGAEGIL